LQLDKSGEKSKLVSAQVIILLIAVIGFFATGGISRTKQAVLIAKQDFQLIKSKINSSDNINAIKQKTQAGLRGKEG
jgi:hypothetical protein